MKKKTQKNTIWVIYISKSFNNMLFYFISLYIQY